MAAKLTEQHLEQIERFLAGKYPALKGARSKQTARDIEIDIRERVVRVEEELKNQREIIRDMMAGMDKRFEQMDKRFEQVDKRFEQVDKRFELVDKRFEEMRLDMESRFKMMMWFMGAGFTFTTTIIAVITVLVK